MEGSEVVNVHAPEFLSTVNSLVDSVQDRTIANYIVWRLVELSIQLNIEGRIKGVATVLGSGET